MKERTDKQPLDELFARKLENMSLPPSPDGFARLQARMGKGTIEQKIVFWREPAIQRYMAIAACLLVVCLFGWLYMANEADSVSKGDVVAVNPTTPGTKNGQPEAQAAHKPADNGAVTPTAPEGVTPNLASEKAAELVAVEINKEKAGGAKATDQRVALEKPAIDKAKKQPLKMPVQEMVKPAEQIARIEVSPVMAEPVIDKPVIAAVNKPVPTAERVLVVTIAEPEALVAARRTVKASAQDETVADADAKSDKEAKAGSLWSQVKRLKQGEIFARKDEGEDDRGLLGRAYSGLKHSLDKDKSIKQ